MMLHMMLNAKSQLQFWQHLGDTFQPVWHFTVVIFLECLVDKNPFRLASGLCALEM